MAGQIAELANRTLRNDFRRIDPTRARIILVDAVDQVLPSFGDRLGGAAERRLTDMGVDVRLGTMVTDVDSTGIVVREPDGSSTRIEALTKVWAAGVQASPLGRQLAEQSGAEVDRAGRVKVLPDLTLPGHPEVHVVGDMMSLDDLPGVAQVAIQGARFSARQIRNRLDGKPTDERFEYFDKGSMATISRFSAVASIGRLRFAGFFAWVLWLGIHLVYIIGFKHRVTTLLHWAVSFLGRGRAERVATEQQVFGRRAMQGRLADDVPSIPTGPEDHEVGSVAELEERHRGGSGHQHAG
jgi:NADH dehydrogenase